MQITRLDNYLNSIGYLIIPMSTTNSPTPRMGGNAITKEMHQISCRHREVKNLSEVTAYQDPSYLTTDWHLTAASTVIV